MCFTVAANGGPVGGWLLLEQVSLFLGHSNIHPLFLLYNKKRGVSRYLSLLEDDFILTRQTNRRTAHILPRPICRGERLRCRVSRRLLFPKDFAFSFLLGMRHEDCSVCIFHRSILQRPGLRPVTRVNPVRLLGCWECGNRRLKLFFTSGMIKSTKVLPVTH